MFPTFVKCVNGPLPECDVFFYRVLPLFDCVYIIGAIIGLIAAKMHSPLIYSFFKLVHYIKLNKNNKNQVCPR